MADLFDEYPKLNKIMDGELTKNEMKQLEDKLCAGADKFLSCAIDLRDTMVYHNRHETRKELVLDELRETLEEYGAMPSPERAEKVKEDAKALQQEADEQLDKHKDELGLKTPEEQAEEVMKRDEEKLEPERTQDDIDAEIEEEIFSALGKKGDPMTIPSLDDNISKFDYGQIETRVYELLAEGLLVQEVNDDYEIVVYPSTWGGEEPDEEDEGLDFDEIERMAGEEGMSPSAVVVREAMAEASAYPDTVRPAYNDWKAGKIDQDEFQKRVVSKTGVDQFMEIREASLDALEEYENR